MLLLPLIAFATAATAAQVCKPQPGSPDWPSPAQWQALNASASGTLVAVSAPAAACHPGPNFDNTTCAFIYSQWSNSSFHAANPWSSDYNDEACLPSAQAPCSTATYPAYAIEATCAADVQAAVRFAAKTGVRLVVKGTGHDYPGRSTGAGSLLLWTHKLTGIEINNGAAKLHAGTRMHDLYLAAAANNVTVVGGSDPSVGVGGFMMNGGHSPMSGLWGLGADQIIAMDVVTADGEIRTLDTKTGNKDLFWAVRGGGGSTFAVMLTLTVKTYPTVSGTTYTFSYNTTANSETYWDLVTYWSSKMPTVSNMGGMGYYYMFPNTGAPDQSTAGVFYGIFIFPHKTVAQTNAIMATVAHGFNSSVAIANYSIATPFSNFMERWASDPPEAVGNDARLGSWLLDMPALIGSRSKLKAALKASIPPVPGAAFLGHLVAGKGVKNAQIPTGSNAVLPAWRNAYVHAVIPITWGPLNATGKAAATKYLRDTIQPALKGLAPNSGSYINEADPSNINWKNDYFGANYPRLLKIKKQWDPNGVFWCKPCVGHELWQWVDGPAKEDPLEWGIGQSSGKLCRS